MAIDEPALSRLQSALDARANPKSRAFWSRYLKGEATFRGVPMAGVRTAVHGWWKEEAFGGLPPTLQKRVALRLFEEEAAEDKLAGVLLLAETLLPELSEQDLPTFAGLFEQGHVADWNLCDWFCVKVLSRMIDEADDPLGLAEAISKWRGAVPLWQRRASCVAFVPHAPYGDRRIPGLSALVLRNADSLVRDPARFAQTGVGWVLRELSRADRRAVIGFAQDHLGHLSREGLRSMIQKMPPGEQQRLLDQHLEKRRLRRTDGSG